MSEERPERRPQRDLLAKFYGLVDEDVGDGGNLSKKGKREQELDIKLPAINQSDNPFDINGPAFDSDLYTQKLLKEASLSQLMNREMEINREIGTLDSEMQTLVYENYNKFIAATDTIKKMRVDFRDMEDEMDQLASKMQNITVFSKQLTDTLHDRRHQVGKLSQTHAQLKKLQFLFELPAKLKSCVAEDDFVLAVRYFLRAEKVLEQYEHMTSFRGIKDDCFKIIVELKEKLYRKIKDQETMGDDRTSCVDLLLQLGEPSDHLCQVYLETSMIGLEDSLQELEKQVKLLKENISTEECERPSDAYQAPMNILEFVDLGCNSFISDLSLIIGSFNETFIQRTSTSQAIPDASNIMSRINTDAANEKLTNFVTKLVHRFLSTIQSRFKEEKNMETTAIFVRALDRVHRRIQAMSRLLPTTDFSKAALDLVLEAADLHCKNALNFLNDDLQEHVIQIRKTLAAPPGRKATSDGSGEINLSELNASLIANITQKVREQLSNLQLFIDQELTFAVKTYFRAKFSRIFVRERVLVSHFSYFIDMAQNFGYDGDKVTPPVLLLLLSRTCYDLQLNTCQYLVSQVEEQFFIEDSSASSSKESGGLTSLSKINTAFREVSQVLLNQYVKAQGGVLSQMLRKSIETRDWLKSVEPRNVRAAMKRVVEETTTVDRQVGTLYEEGSRKSTNSDSSSRRTRPSQQHRLNMNRSNWSMTTSHSQLDASVASNIQKMFSEKIEIFAPVDFSHISILTGIVKIALKTLLESIRQRTFSKYGFQQIQVDVHYLDLYMWRFVNDENLVAFLLDEVMTSAVHRCPEPVPMESSIVEMICDRS